MEVCLISKSIEGNMGTQSKSVTFDTDYGMVGMTVDPLVGDSDFNLVGSSMKNDGECGSTFDFASKAFVASLVATRLAELKRQLDDISKRIDSLEQTAKNPK